jgi:hypothetical protein
VLDITIISLGLAVLALSFVMMSVLFGRRRKTSRSIEWTALDLEALLDDVRRRVEKAEERIVDVKVKLEVLEMRVMRGQSKVAMEPGTETVSDAREVAVPRPIHSSVDRGSELTETKGRIMRLLVESSDGLTAKQVRDTIGLSREHVARMMSLLFREGAVQRKTGSRPFVYVVTEDRVSG